MSSDNLEVKKRDLVGTLPSRKLRQTGRVPAVLYGHGEENVHLTVKSDAISRIIHHGTKLLTLTGDVAETALLRDVQWDAFGMDVLHVDFARVSRTEAVEVTLPVELHGEAPGSNEGGQLNFVAHDLTILCPASKIPDHLHVNVSNLHLGQAILAGEVGLPEGASMVTAANEVVVQIIKHSAEEDDLLLESTGDEPEVIGKHTSDEEES